MKVAGRRSAPAATDRRRGRDRSHLPFFRKYTILEERPHAGDGGFFMIVSQRARALLKTLVVVLSVAMPLTFAVTAADARGGGGFSSGSRGSRTIAPNAAQPMQRTITPQ